MIFPALRHFGLVTTGNICKKTSPFFSAEQIILSKQRSSSLSRTFFNASFSLSRLGGFPRSRILNNKRTKNCFQVQAVKLSTENSATVANGATKKASSFDTALDKLFGIICGFGLGYALAGTLAFVFEFPEPCQIIWEMCENNDEVLKEFGRPLSKSLFWDGSVTEWQASVTLNISGENGDGTLVGRLLKSKDGRWKPLLVVARKEKKLITLVDGSTSPDFGK